MSNRVKDGKGSFIRANVDSIRRTLLQGYNSSTTLGIRWGNRLFSTIGKLVQMNVERPWLFCGQLRRRLYGLFLRIHVVPLGSRYNDRHKRPGRPVSALTADVFHTPGFFPGSSDTQDVQPANGLPQGDFVPSSSLDSAPSGAGGQPNVFQETLGLDDCVDIAQRLEPGYVQHSCDYILGCRQGGLEDSDAARQKYNHDNNGAQPQTVYIQQLLASPMRPGAIRGGRGYLMIDNRAAGGELIEMPTLTCCHCFTIVALNLERTRERGWCPKQNAYRCDDNMCATNCALGVCPPIEQCVELAQKYPGLPTLPRAKDGGLLFDPEILKEGKVY